MDRYPVVLAIDAINCDKRIILLSEELSQVLSGFKVGLPTLISCGTAFLKDLRDAVGDALMIADLKLADIGDIMVRTTSLVKDYVDAVIAHAFVGRRGGLDVLSEELSRWDVKLILVASMSHPGSQEFYDAITDRVIGLVRDLNAWGVVAPATRPGVIRVIRDRLRDVKIFSPGVGVQGARPGEALCAGADYEIVGRAILEASDPLAAAKSVGEEALGAMKRCQRA